MEDTAYMYYQQTPIMRRIHEYTDGAISVTGANPRPDAEKRVSKFSDIMGAINQGMDLHRSVQSLSGPLLVLDLEYVNQRFPGEAFHKPMQTFEKLEPTRQAIRDLLDMNGIDHIELMTGRGYNFVTKLTRTFQSYKALLGMGKKMRVLPSTAVPCLKEREERFGDVPHLADNVVFSAFGRITDYIFDQLKSCPGLPLRTTDLFGNENEISALDTTSYGYMVFRRSVRSAFSLHQKFMSNPVYDYQGPPIVAITSKGIPLKEKIAIRQDPEGNYRKAVGLASEVNASIPEGDMTILATSYLMSDTWKRHERLGHELDKVPTLHYGEEISDDPITGAGFSDEDFWDPVDADYLKDKLKGTNLGIVARESLARPNDLMLRPRVLADIAYELRESGFSFPEAIGVVAMSYMGDHGWLADITKNDPWVRAEYWMRTLGDF